MTAQPLQALPETDLRVAQLAYQFERARADHLATAVLTNRRIGIAVGIVMLQCNLTDAEAFEALRLTSMNTNRRLADLADDVISLRGLSPLQQAPLF